MQAFGARLPGRYFSVLKRLCSGVEGSVQILTEGAVQYPGSSTGGVAPLSASWSATRDESRTRMEWNYTQK